MPHMINRYILPILLYKLRFAPVVSLHGARQVGKSYLVREILPSTLGPQIYVTMDKSSDRSLANNAPDSFIEKLKNEGLAIIDEAQKAPPLFDAIKHSVDNHRVPGQFILLGSTEFSKRTLIRESLTGRMSGLKLYPLTAAEALSLPFEKSESCLRFSKNPRCTRQELMRHLSRGGMPGIFAVHSDRERINLYKDWIDLTILRGLNLIPGVKLDSELALDILREIATNPEPTASQIAKKLKRDVRRIQTHLNCLQMLFVIHRLNPIQESTGKPLYFICDVGLANYLDAPFDRALHTWIVQEAFAAQEWRENIKESIGYYRSSKGAMTHLVLKSSASLWTAIKIIPHEKLSKIDLLSLHALKKKVPTSTQIKLIALSATTANIDGIDCLPWESIV
jgi:uncharacterized protein